MAFGIILSIIMSAGILDVAASASLAGKAASAQHLRTKRCSCASFMDKECVYFCHLDIIWVNTPERTVSYGLGNPPRLKRSVPEDAVTSSRCRCADGQDTTCSTFCQPNSAVRFQPDWTEENPAVQGHGKHKTEISRLRKAEPVSDVHSKVSTRMRVLMEKWRTSGGHRP